jgi:hypothetical protein
MLTNIPSKEASYRIFLLDFVRMPVCIILNLLENWSLYFVKCFDRLSRKSYDKGKTLQTRQSFLVRT